MLGSAVGQYFQSMPDKYDVWLTARDLSLAYGKKTNWIGFDPTSRAQDTVATLSDVFGQMVKSPDCVIGCVGTIKPSMDKNLRDAIYINSVLPHELAATCTALHVKMIHVTTDCVFSGKTGGYSESSPHDPLDAYGKSKSLGETKDCMVIRTSIIGEEIHKNASLVEWVKSQAGKSVNGFTNHYWNGMTTKQYASVCDQIIDGDMYEPGTFHVHSDTVTKEQLLHMINERYNLGLTIIPTEASEAIDRTLSTEKPLLQKLKISTLKGQVMNL